jgi:transcriptional regulator with XRE-family HTH domain
MSTRNEPDYTAGDQRYWRKRMKELTFAQTVRAYRLAEGWTLTGTAEKLGISKQQLSDYENGRKLPSIEKAYRIAKALDMLPQSLVLQVINEQLRRAAIPIQVDVAS